MAQLEPTVVQPEPDQAPADMNFTDECAPASTRPGRGSRRAARAAPPSDVTGWCVDAGDNELPICSRREGCTHAPGAAEYCTLVGGASDVDSDGDASPRAEADAPALAPHSEPALTTEEQRDVRRKELNAAAQRRSRALRKERLAEEAVALTVERRALVADAELSRLTPGPHVQSVASAQ
ncbi:hypothetical protein T492DRAFT_1108008 [Pavlovales sp. CCMP2436]|nr:hypothetical protein T492DRAFT_1108008 [Pavlovales sp. CCMP2436]